MKTNACKLVTVAVVVGVLVAGLVGCAPPAPPPPEATAPPEEAPTAPPPS